MLTVSNKKICPLVLIISLLNPFKSVFLFKIEKFARFVESKHIGQEVLDQFDFALQQLPLSFNFCYHFAEVGFALPS
jgi:hypothetical protein